ncbi:nickel/cobalt transporter [Vibrio sp. RC27]
MMTNSIRNTRTITLISIVLLIVFGVYQLWLIWPTIIVASAQWQREINAEIADLLYEAQTNPLVAGGYLAGLSFLYGMFHSLGPGHGKVIVTTYLATHPTKVKTSLILTVVSALCQALVAIVLVSILVWGFSMSMRAVNETAMLFVSVSFALVAILGVLICWKATRKIYRSLSPATFQIHAAMPLNNPSLAGQKPIISNSVVKSSMLLNNDMTRSQTHVAQDNSHHHGETCGCGHQHVADADAINRASTLKEYIGIIATIGIRPCTGAIMVLLFANVVGLYWMGVVSAIVMAVGTAFTTSVIAILTLTGKQLVRRYLVTSDRDRKSGWKLAGYSLQLFGGVFLIVIGLILLSGTEYGMSPVFSL